MARQRNRRFCFTINNPTDEDLQAVDTVECRYLVAGDEVGESGTPHIQGYVEFEAAYSLATAGKLLGGRASCRAARGTAMENKVYCSKESVYVERGAPGRPGARNDIAAVKEIIKSGGNMRDVIDAVNSYQAMKAGEMIFKYKQNNERKAPEVVWYWGPSGTGKTRQAVEEAGQDMWMSSRNLKWWDGYDGQKNVIIDDFRADFCTFHELLRILDRYPMRVELKGGSRLLEAEKIWVTSAHAPEHVYPNCGERVDQLLRRIKSTTRFGLVPREVVQRLGVIMDPQPPLDEL